jgi:hypothetical protein
MTAINGKDRLSSRCRIVLAFLLVDMMAFNSKSRARELPGSMAASQVMRLLGSDQGVGRAYRRIGPVSPASNSLFREQPGIDLKVVVTRLNILAPSTLTIPITRHNPVATS